MEGNPAPLVLVPTERERMALAAALPRDLEPVLCGMGLAASGVLAARILHERRPSRVWLLGIAGTYDAGALPVGSAAWFGVVSSAGLGVEEDGGTAWPNRLERGRAQGRVVPESFALADPEGPRLLSVAAATLGIDRARALAARNGSALAEDMEGWSVALAAWAADVPLSVGRGISNVAGDRSKASWRMQDALEAIAWLANDRWREECA